ncbi:PREDICTED: aspartyl protease family protein At5g10770-like [Nelumbo nucifera]|uniref:Aspartyl protease family protein At5g10770-like n=1 Tax=Nelumbo nucifera TaxID=4432 RepID=A0A1U7ZX48_NELNU|nr:PREDICTED: aspartyl protease family protein At5g10770-like [Nelumbo nucifera]
MAIATSSFLCFLLSCSLLLAHGGEIADSHHHVIVTNSLIPAKTCTQSPKVSGSNQLRKLQVVHINGPCSPLGQGKKTNLNLGQILLQDELRVRSIHSRISNSKQSPLADSKAKIPAKSGRSLGTGNFVVNVGLGTPKRDLTLIFDTGSDLTWIQCKPCAVNCYQQNEPTFDPSQSSTYSNISCGSAECTQVGLATGNSPRCSSTCIYGVLYGDNSYSVGFYGRETLTLSASDVFPNFEFGCGQNNRGLFGSAAGLLGLGRNQISLVSQTATKFGKKFSYCLPSTSSGTGFLAFGNQVGTSSSSVKYTSLLTDSRGNSFYFVPLLGISVKGQRLAIPPTAFTSSGTIIDSGTVITRLPPAAYAALRSAFRQAMSKYPSTSSLSILDTCYDLSGYNTVTIPTITLHFGGGTGLAVDSSGILVVASLSQVCLAFAGNSDPSDVAILGNKQQQTFEVVYDVTGGKLGFGAGGCS